MDFLYPYCDEDQLGELRTKDTPDIAINCLVSSLAVVFISCSIFHDFLPVFTVVHKEFSLLYFDSAKAVGFPGLWRKPENLFCGIRIRAFLRSVGKGTARKQDHAGGGWVRLPGRSRNVVGWNISRTEYDCLYLPHNNINAKMALP